MLNQGSGTPFVAFLSVAPKLAGFTALAAIFLRALPSTAHSREPVLLAVCATSIVVGNLLALVQTNVKRLLAYSGIGHIGFMLLAFASGQDGTQMLLFYAVAYVVTNMGAFQVVELVEEQVGDTSLTAFNGLARRAPALAFAMLLFLLSLAGIPFVVGFWAKLNVFMTAWQAGLYWLVIVGAVLTVALVHNASQMLKDSAGHCDSGALRQVLETNVVAINSINQQLLPRLPRSSSVLYVGSTLSEKAVPGSFSYVVSKHAQLGMMRATCQDLMGSGLHTALICPGFTDTEMLRTHLGGDPSLERMFAEMNSFGRLIDPAEIAELIRWAHHNPVINGSVLHANLGQKES